MAVDTWTDDMDAALLEQRGKRRLAWKVVHIEGATRKECQDRFKFLTSGQGKPVVRVAERGPDPDEDGLERLKRKGKLTPTRLYWALRYRETGRLADMEGGSVRSCLDIQVRGGLGSGGGCSEGILPGIVSAKREMLIWRRVVLKSQSDMLTVMDGVCLSDHTLMALAGGNDRRAGQLEAVLMVALDLLATWGEEQRKRAA